MSANIPQHQRVVIVGAGIIGWKQCGSLSVETLHAAGKPFGLVNAGYYTIESRPAGFVTSANSCLPRFI